MATYHSLFWVSEINPVKLQTYDEVYDENLNCSMVMSNTKFLLREKEIAEWEARNYGKPYDWDFNNLSMNLPLIPDTIKVGDILGFEGLKAYHGTNNTELATWNCEVVGHCMYDDFIPFVKVIIENKMFFGSILPKIEHDLDAENARSESNEVLLIAWNDEKENLQSHIITHSGSYMFHQEENTAQDCGLNAPPGPGIWRLKDGKSYFYGDGIWDDYESGMDGDWHDVAEKDVQEMGLTLDQFIYKIREMIGGGYEFPGENALSEMTDLNDFKLEHVRILLQSPSESSVHHKR